jgi:hypothetical protein
MYSHLTSFDKEVYSTACTMPISRTDVLGNQRKPIQVLPPGQMTFAHAMEHATQGTSDAAERALRMLHVGAHIREPWTYQTTTS